MIAKSAGFRPRGLRGRRTIVMGALLAFLTAGLIDGPVAHRAMADARLTLEAYRHYVGRLMPRPLPESAPAPGPDAA